MVASESMIETGSNQVLEAGAELQRGAFPLGLPTDGLPRSEAFSQLVHARGVRAQRDMYPRNNFNAALEVAALTGLECYRFLRRSFLGKDHVPIALVPRGTNVVLAHIPAVFSQASFSSVKSASSSFRSFRSMLSGRYTNSGSRTQLLCSAPEIDLASHTRLISDCDDSYVKLINGGQSSIDKLAVVISIFADGEEGAQAFRHELARRGVQVTSESLPQPGNYRRRSGKLLAK
ncbi:hypothetical protein VOLCADRAFT_91005 [Volvox carteri f. nagariensis]|uniref:Uncharacterized protein n=1 Tax=Volvox carteri f. nagariensis TaxID=3068 RepID=D8TVX8_VOLCA|nr:uncharacterized protein VOLCADRAFT_91005 [Volvox carteri f. nagariensis]EFJ48270.1 hypothetical protein VOLCADRAFT_91005 [Volvox carteri f. nagariensis]|eukprot:XP_002950524.1 hypothetical protein VOLCADRAFT_91005 [Volvox carteri f. nagariensis]